jgi:hypothetical protein
MSQLSATMSRPGVVIPSAARVAAISAQHDDAETFILPIHVYHNTMIGSREPIVTRGGPKTIPGFICRANLAQ